MSTPRTTADLTKPQRPHRRPPAQQCVTFKNTSLTEPLVALRYFGPEVNPNAPAMGAYKNV